MCGIPLPLLAASMPAGRLAGGLGGGRLGGFTRFELLVSLALIGIFSSLLMERVVFYRVQAEQTAVQQMVGQLRLSLQLQVVVLLARNREHELENLARQSPMQWLAQRPANYLGEFYRIQEHEVEPGNWYFERQSGQLVYLFARTTGKTGGNRLYLKTNLLRVPSAAGQAGKIAAVVLEQRAY